MNNILEFFIKMRDLTPPQIAKTVENVRKIEKTADIANRSLQTTSDRIRQIGSSDPSAGAVRGLQNIRREAEKLNSELSKTVSSVSEKSNKSGGLGSWGKRFLAGAALTAGITLGSSSIGAAMDFGAQQKSYEVLTGSKQRGRELAGELAQLKQNTIMGAAVYQNAQTMLGFGIGDKEVIKDLKMLGDVSMGNAEKLGSLTLAFSQTRAAGRLMGQDLLQYINAGFNPLYDISQMTGKSIGQLRKEMENGAISAEMVTKAFEHATSKGGKFYNMMNEISDTPFGKKQMLKGQWQAFKISLGEMLTPVAEQFMDLGTSVINALNPHKRMSQTLLAEKMETNALIQSISKLNEGNQQRRAMLQFLTAKYPELLGNIDLEKVTNEELLKKLNEINDAYQRRIDIAASGELIDAMKNQIKQLDDAFMKSSVYAQLLKNGGIENLAKVDSFGAGMISWLWGEKGGIKRLSNIADKSQAQASQLRQQLEFKQRQDEEMKNMAMVEDIYAKIQSGDKSITAKVANEVKRIMPDVQLFRNSDGTINNLVGYDFGKLKAGGINGKTGATGVSGESGGKSVASGITGGGPRVVNINGVNMKLSDTLTVNTTGGEDFLKQVEPRLEEFFLRVLNSGASVQ